MSREAIKVKLVGMSSEERAMFDTLPAGVRKDLIKAYFDARDIGGAAFEKAKGMLLAHDGD
ncbi:hypothetical protein EPO14_01700 [Patescibacteria group bacterium]|nr:MAG: hypothetical protein EPO14_01700 [Patescibacteria group bacterium]